MAKDLDRMSFRELQELELKLKKAKASAEDRTRAEVRSKVEALIASAGFKVSDIFGGRGGKGRTVAAKYANDKDAYKKLAEKIQKGGSGVWGAMAMPPNAVTPAEAETLAKWVLTIK